MVVDDSVARAQPQSRSFANRSSRIEGIEDSFRVASARTVVGKLQHNRVLLTPTLDGEKSPAHLAQGVQRVALDVQKDLEKLIRVPRNLRQFVSEANLQFDAVGTELRLIVFDGSLDNGIYVYRNLLAGNLSREIQQACDQYSRAPHLLRNLEARLRCSSVRPDSASNSE